MQQANGVNELLPGCHNQVAEARPSSVKSSSEIRFTGVAINSLNAGSTQSPMRKLRAKTKPESW